MITRFHRTAAIVLFILVLGACTEVPEYPLDSPEAGFTRLQWGMTPDSAHALMTSMPAVVAVSETVMTIRGGRFATPISDDTVQVIHDPMPDTHARLVRYTGGTFLGEPVHRWTLEYAEMEHLEYISLELAPSDRNKLRQDAMGRIFALRYTPAGEEAWGPAGGRRLFESADIAGSKLGQSGPVTTRVSLVNGGDNGVTSFGYWDSDRQRRREERRTGMTISRMGVKEWEAMEKREKRR